MKDEITAIILKYTPELCDKIDLEGDLIDRLLASKTITKQHRSVINVAVLTSEQKVGKLLEILVKRNDECFDTFCKELAKEQSDLVMKYLTLPVPLLVPDINVTPAANVTNDVKADSSKDEKKQKPVCLLSNDEIKERIHSNYVAIAAKLDPKGHVLNKLFQEGIITEREFKDLDKKSSDEDRGNDLLQLILKGSNPKACTVFRESLLGVKAFEYIVDLIDN